MKKLVIFAIFFSFSAFPCSDLLDTDVKVLNENQLKNLCEYDNHTILVVNTASKCGFTYQYEQLESLQRRFKDKKFTVLGFPSRNFLGQEFNDEAKVSEFCKSTFDVSFPLFSIVFFRFPLFGVPGVPPLLFLIFLSFVCFLFLCFS